MQIRLYSTYSYLIIFVMFLNLNYNVNFYRNLIFFRYLRFCHTKRRFPFLVEIQISSFLLYSFLLFGITSRVYRRSDWHWGTQSIIEWQEALLSLKTHKTSVGSDNDVAMVIKVCVFLSQKGQWSVWYSNYFSSKFYL